MTDVEHRRRDNASTILGRKLMRRTSGSRLIRKSEFESRINFVSNFGVGGGLHRVRFAGGVGGFNPPLVVDDPLTGDRQFWSGGVGFDPPSPLQQDQDGMAWR